jgi:hypothetical protein
LRRSLAAHFFVAPPLNGIPDSAVTNFLFVGVSVTMDLTKPVRSSNGLDSATKGEAAGIFERFMANLCLLKFSHAGCRPRTSPLDARMEAFLTETYSIYRRIWQKYN